jgi:hypothetical protein
VSDGPAGQLAQLFDGLRLADIARVLGLELQQFASLAAEVPAIDAYVLRSVAAERRFDLVPLFEACLLRDGGVRALEVLEQTLPFLPAADRETALRACIVPRAWTSMPANGVLHRLHAAWQAPLPTELARELLASPAWADTLARVAENATSSAAEAIEATAPLIPHALSERFIGEIGAFARRSMNFHRFLLALPLPD